MPPATAAFFKSLEKGSAGGITSSLTPESLKGVREGAGKQLTAMQEVIQKEFDIQGKCDIQRFMIPGSENVQIEMIMVKPKCLMNVKSASLVYAHGGGVIMVVWQIDLLNPE